MSKLDIRREHKALYNPPAGRFVLVDVPPFDFLMIDGVGNPNTSQDYVAAVEALYTTAYTLKFMIKRQSGTDYVVPLLEGLWWADDYQAFTTRNKAAWKWTMMVCVPVPVAAAIIDAAFADARRKRPDHPIHRLRFERLEEGPAAQAMHVGSYDDEGPLLYALHHGFLPENKLVPTGHHHEIYLSDPRKTIPERRRTILRQPVEPIT